MEDIGTLEEFQRFFTNHFVMCVIWAACLGGIIYIQARLLIARVPKATVNMAVLMANHDDGTFVDHRSPEQFAQGHITNAVNLTALEIKQERLQQIDRRKDAPVILVGRDKFDGDSFNCARFLKKFGFTKVYILEGGMASWTEQNLPVTTKK
ncbi:MAG: rhodanese-like domain-containing protein [Succinivibrionaceae bacterium]|nr:rhodanese-like domain-containing protein [Succinivibrionaceae bacterium]